LKKNVSIFFIILLVFFAAYPSYGQQITGEKKEIVVGVCKISIYSNKNGQFSPPASENDFKFAGYEENLSKVNEGAKFGFSIGCESNFSDKNEIANENGAEYDSTSGKWKGFYVSDQDKSLLAPVTKVISFETVNGAGFIRVTDDVIGDDESRDRKLSYCVFDSRLAKKQAICGSGVVMHLAHPQENFLPDALKVLRSVEFLDFEH
jgi:hypothetical protein